MKVVYFFLLLSCIACSRKMSILSGDPSRQINDSVILIEDTNKQGTNLNYDSALMECYQTFDEYILSGIGRATKYPFVYVKRHNDSILVFSSSQADSSRLYVKQDNNVWYSHMEYDMWKREHYTTSKNKLSKPARTYDRFFYNDTILEVKTDYISGKQYCQIFVKCKNNLYVVSNVLCIDCLSISNLRKMVKHLILNDDKRIKQYTLRVDKNSYIYVGKNNSDSYSYEKKSYGLWGMQPGIEETNLYEGIDIREYSDNLRRYQRDNTDIIYEVADEIPVFPGGGTSNFYEYIRNNRSDSLVLSKRPYRVVLEVIIEKDGSITNAKVVSSIDSIHDNDALYIIKTMPRWIPAKLNGNAVRYRMLIPVSYK